MMPTCVELKLVSQTQYKKPFNQVEVEVEFDDPLGNTLRVPAFWAGGQEWRVRYAPATPGTHSYRWRCSDTSNAALHGTESTLHVQPQDTSNAIFPHGRLRVGAGQRHLEFTDGTPFFWLGDTWWLGLVERKGWGVPEFQQLVDDRVAKGFTLIQIVAGLYPDLPPFDPRGFNEAGYPWQRDYACINPSYFDAADQRIEMLVKAGLVPCIVAAWGYHLPLMGSERMKQHWRYLLARWSCYPVVWCLAGEATMPYYLSEQRKQDAAFQKSGWTEIGRYVRELDPYHNPITVHPSAGSRDDLDDYSVVDIQMFGTGHGDWGRVPYHMTTITREVARTPHMPLINAEVCYEGHMQVSWQNVQRFMFWTSMFNSVTGYTYGAAGIWQMNTRLQPHGPSPNGHIYENTPWDEAAHYPGSRQLGLGKQLLERYPWWLLEPMPNSVEPRWHEGNYMLPHAAGIAAQARFVYIPGRVYDWSGPLVKDLGSNARYHAFYFDPIAGDEVDLGIVHASAEGSWQAPSVPLAQDWVLILECQPA